ncbi:hypothetical protein F5B20DRAFT_275561 [Whalleya microplaca]|nr:hypothetical protein F5B20DRAFT_275561 [Whalleya microplaca]
MPIFREPSQRTKAWVKWNYGHNSSKSSLNAPTEIIHLGGSRVGTPEMATLALPGTIKDHRLTTWSQFASPQNSPSADRPKPITLTTIDSREPMLSPADTMSSAESVSSPGLSPAPLSNLSNPLEKILSPVTSSTASTPTSKFQSPPPYSTTPSLPPSSASVRNLRRTQSATDVQKGKPTKWKALPARPMDTHDETDSDTVDNESPVREVHLRPPIRKIIPPLTSPPPDRPLPAVTADQTQEKGALGSVVENPGAKEPKQSLRPSRYSPQERLWLHRNYRGEATFLKAWGLSMDSEEDREEGMAMMRELMESEEDKRGRPKRVEKEASFTMGDSGLQIIVEEPAKQSVPDEDQTPETAQGHQPSKKPPKRALATNKDSHSRSESESSVLGTYLDIRMSRID